MMRHGLAPLLLTLCVLPGPAAEPLAVTELRIQKVGDVTYFHVRLAPPSRMPPADSPRNEGQPSDAEPAPAEARLISPDGKARHIHQRLPILSVPRPGSDSKPEENRRKLTTLQNDQPKLRILTYDDLLAGARASLERILGPLTLSITGENVKLCFFR
jgi:hypothetical protein